MTITDKLKNEYYSCNTKKSKIHFAEQISHNNKLSLWELESLSEIIEQKDAKEIVEDTISKVIFTLWWWEVNFL